MPEQIVEWVAQGTIGGTMGGVVSGLVLAITKWVRARAEWLSAEAKKADAEAARDKLVNERLDRVEHQFAECEESKKSLEIGLDVLREKYAKAEDTIRRHEGVILVMRRKLDSWEQSLAAVGIPAEDSDARTVALETLFRKATAWDARENHADAGAGRNS